MERGTAFSDERTKSVRKTWGSRGAWRYRVTVARAAADQPLNTRRANWHARFMGRQRNHTSTRNSRSSYRPLCHPPRRDDATRILIRRME